MLDLESVSKIRYRQFKDKTSYW